MSTVAGVRRCARNVDAADVAANGPRVLGLMMMISRMAAATSRCVRVRLGLTRMMVIGWQQPAANQIGDERQMGEETLHESGPGKTHMRGIVVKTHTGGVNDSVSMSRSQYVRKIIIVLGGRYSRDPHKLTAHSTASVVGPVRNSSLGKSCIV